MHNVAKVTPGTPGRGQFSGCSEEAARAVLPGPPARAPQPDPSSLEGLHSPSTSGSKDPRARLATTCCERPEAVGRAPGSAWAWQARSTPPGSAQPPSCVPPPPPFLGPPDCGRARASRNSHIRSCSWSLRPGAPGRGLASNLPV